MASLAEALLKHNMLGQDTRAAAVAVAPIFLSPPTNRNPIIRVSGGLSQQLNNLQSYSKRVISTLRAIAAEKIKQQTVIERIDRQEKENNAEMARLQPERRPVEKVEEGDNSDLLSTFLRILREAMAIVGRIADAIAGGIRRILGSLRGLLPSAFGLLRIVPFLLRSLRSPIGLGLGIIGAGIAHRSGTMQRTPTEIPPVTGDFGALSRRFESGGDPGAVGRDRNGGYSYGTYQIATNTGTMNNFMNWLRTRNPSAAEELERAGGVAAATSGSQQFIDTWRRLSQTQEFVQNQREFIQDTHYRPAVSNILADTGINISSRSRALQEVVNSTAIQHGPAGARRIVSRAIAEAGGSSASDADIINRIYDIRSNVTQEFRSSTPREQEAVRNRFVQERAAALRMLQESPSTAQNTPQHRPVNVAPSVTSTTQQTSSYVPRQTGSELLILPVVVGA